MVNDHHHRKKKFKKTGEGTKNIVKSCQKWEKLVKNWYYMHFDTKKYITNKNWVFGGIYNTYEIISNWKKNWKKRRDATKLDRNWSKLAKNEKIVILSNLSQKITRVLINLVSWLMNDDHQKKYLKKM